MSKYVRASRTYTKTGGGVHRFERPLHRLQGIGSERLWTILNRLYGRIGQGALARGLGVSQPYISQLLAGKKAPRRLRVATARRLAGLCGRMGVRV